MCLQICINFKLIFTGANEIVSVSIGYDEGNNTRNLVKNGILVIASITPRAGNVFNLQLD